MVKKDGISIFYRGLIPAFNAQVFLYVAVEWARKLLIEEKTPGMEYVWPLFFLAGCIFAHP